MTFEEWIVFILFTIGINVIIQKIAWEIGVSIAKKREVKKMSKCDKCTRGQTVFVHGEPIKCCPYVNNCPKEEKKKAVRNETQI